MFVCVFDDDYCYFDVVVVVVFYRFIAPYHQNGGYIHNVDWLSSMMAIIIIDGCGCDYFVFSKEIFPFRFNWSIVVNHCHDDDDGHLIIMSLID